MDVLFDPDLISFRSITSKSLYLSSRLLLQLSPGVVYIYMYIHPCINCNTTTRRVVVGFFSTFFPSFPPFLSFPLSLHPSMHPILPPHPTPSHPIPSYPIPSIPPLSHPIPSHSIPSLSYPSYPPFPQQPQPPPQPKKPQFPHPGLSAHSQQSKNPS